jgi:hypothetical protein
MEHVYLEKIVHSFVAAERRDRLKSLLQSKKRYSDFLEGLLHDSRHLDAAVIEVLVGRDRLLEGVIARMAALGVSGKAYLVGNCGVHDDGVIDDVEVLLQGCVGSMTDCLVYSWTSNIAYYEGHEGFGCIYRKKETQGRAKR